MKRKILFWGGIAISAVLLYFALRNIKIGEFVDTLRHANLKYMIGAFSLIIGLYTVRALRWHTIIRARYRVPYFTTFRIEMIGLFANNVLPARAGEIVRAFFLQREARVTKSYALGTILVDRVTDLAILLVLLLIAFTRIPEHLIPSGVTGVRLIATLAVSVFIVGQIVLVRFREFVVRLLENILKRFVSAEVAHKIADRFDDFTRGLEVLRNPGRLIAVIAMAFTIWGGMTLGFYLIFCGLGFDVPFNAAVTTIALVNLGLLVPSSPGYVGPYEFFVILSLGIYGVGESAALAFALVSRLAWYLVEIGVGFIMLVTSETKIGQLMEVTQSDEGAVDLGSQQQPAQPVSKE